MLPEILAEGKNALHTKIRVFCVLGWFLEWALSDFSGVGGELHLVKMESRNPTTWKPLSSPSGTTVGGVLGGRRGRIGAWRLRALCPSSQNGHLACVGPVGLLQAPELKGRAFFHIPTCTRTGGPGLGVPSCSGVSGQSILSRSPGRGGRNRTISTSSSHQLFLPKTLKASSLDLLKD